MMRELFTSLICPFFGTIGYAVIFQIPRKYYISCGLTGTLGWLVYHTASMRLSVGVSAFLGALVVVLFARMLTVRMKCPITIFLVSGIFPLVPGAGIYFTAYHFFSNQFSEAAARGMESVKIAFGIVLGIVLVLFLPRDLFFVSYWRQRRLKKQEARKKQG